MRARKEERKDESDSGLMTTIMTESVQNWHFYLEAWGAKTTHDTHKNVSGMEDTLEEIFLSHNLLGDNLSPVFSTRFDTKTYFIRFPLTQNSFSSLLCNDHPPQRVPEPEVPARARPLPQRTHRHRGEPDQGLRGTQGTKRLLERG